MQALASVLVFKVCAALLEPVATSGWSPVWAIWRMC